MDDTFGTLELTGMDHLGINITDLQRSADWYERVLGLGVLHLWKTRWLVSRGNIKLGSSSGLMPSRSPIPTTRS